MARKGSRRAERRLSPDQRNGKAQVQKNWLNHKTALMVVWALFLVHSLGLACLFLPFSGLFDNQPIIEQDWGLHFHHLESLVAFWRRDKISWGYNPFFMAGYPSNTIQDLSIKFFEWLALALSTVAFSPIQAFKIVAFLAMASVPWIGYFAMRNFLHGDHSEHLAATVAALLATVYWWNSLPREMFYYGMIGFPVASYLSILGVSLFYRLAQHPGRFAALHFGWLIFAVVILPLHVQSVVIFLPAMIALIFIRRLLLSSGFWLWIAAAVAFSFLVNAAWLVPAINHRADDMSAEIADQLRLFVTSDPLTFVKDYLGPYDYWTFRPSFIEKGYRLALLALGVWGTWQWLHSEKRDLGIMIVSSLAVLFLVTYFGSLTPFMKSWQPFRFKVPFDLFLVIGAADTVSRWLSGPAHWRSRFMPVLLSGALIAFLINVAQTEATGKLQLRSQINPALEQIVTWIQRETPVEGRVLFEE